METLAAYILPIIILFLLLLFLLFFLKRSSDIKLVDDLLIIRYPFQKKELNLSRELISWHLQEAYFWRIGRIYSINLELENGKWQRVNSRFNRKSFEALLRYLTENHPTKQQSVN